MQVMKLDELANETLITTLARRGHCAAVAAKKKTRLKVLSETSARATW